LFSGAKVGISARPTKGVASALTQFKGFGNGEKMVRKTANFLISHGPCAADFPQAPAAIALPVGSAGERLPGAKNFCTLEGLNVQNGENASPR